MMREPFKKIRNVYGEKLVEAPKKEKRKPLNSLTEIFAYNKLRNEADNRSTFVFNTFLIIGIGLFIAFLLLYMSGTLEFMA